MKKTPKNTPAKNTAPVAPVENPLAVLDTVDVENGADDGAPVENKDGEKEGETTEGKKRGRQAGWKSEIETPIKRLVEKCGKPALNLMVEIELVKPAEKAKTPAEVQALFLAAFAATPEKLTDPAFMRSLAAPTKVGGVVKKQTIGQWMAEKGEDFKLAVPRKAISEFCNSLAHNLNAALTTCADDYVAPAAGEIAPEGEENKEEEKEVAETATA